MGAGHLEGGRMAVKRPSILAILLFSLVLVSCGGVEESEPEFELGINPRAITSSPKPNLVFYIPLGWDGRVIPSHAPDATTIGTLWECQPTYINFMVTNVGDAATNGNTIWTSIYLTNNYLENDYLDSGWTTDILEPGDGRTASQMREFLKSPYFIRAGEHTLRAVIDPPSPNGPSIIILKTARPTLAPCFLL